MSAAKELATFGATGGLVLLGSVVPVVPTGPIFTAGMAYVASDHLALVPLMLAVGVAACFCGDVITFAATRFGGPRLVAWIGRRVNTKTVDRLVARIDEQGGRLLVISRLVPAGRIPCLLAAGAAGFPWRSFVPWQLAGCAAWALLYGVLGLVGGSFVRSPLVSIGIAIVLLAVVQIVQTIVRRHRAAA